MTYKFESDWSPDDGGTEENVSPTTSFDSMMDKMDGIDEQVGVETDANTNVSIASSTRQTDEIDDISNDADDDEVRRRLADPEIDRYRKELEDDLRLTHKDGSVDLSAFKTKTFMEAATRGKWLSYLYKEKEIMTALKTKIADFNQSVTAKIMAGPGNGFEKQQRVTAYLKSSEGLAAMHAAQKAQQNKIDFLTEANEIMSKFGYSIRNGIDYLKLQFS